MTPDQLAALHRIAEAAVAAERETGCPAEISAAQCIVESAWLQVAPGNNCFGVKATDDHCQYCLTKEYLNGEWTSQKLAFATYPTLAACFAAHARLLQSGRMHQLGCFTRVTTIWTRTSGASQSITPPTQTTPPRSSNSPTVPM